MQLVDLESQERAVYNKEKQYGSLFLKRKVIGLRPKKQSVADMMQKIRPEMRILVEYSCDQITQGGTLRYVPYQDTTSQTMQRYLYTLDQMPECWLPQLLGSD